MRLHQAAPVILVSMVRQAFAWLDGLDRRLFARIHGNRPPRRLPWLGWILIVCGSADAISGITQLAGNSLLFSGTVATVMGMAFLGLGVVTLIRRRNG
jgi:hypothetical protein